MKQRTIEALRNLAERPGTEAEGILARELLARLEKHEEPEDRGDFWKAIDARAHGEMSEADFHEALLRDIKRQQERPIPTTWKCPCGLWESVGMKCLNIVGHKNIQREIRERFKKGEAVFYNYWCYPANCPATVTGYVLDTPENGTHPWAWIKLRFSHFKNTTYRQVPIYSAKGWHLSKEPLSTDEAKRMAR